MITKKLAVPLINEKILSQAEHCYIATASITDAGFDMIRSRINTKCKMDIVTGMDGLTSPNVLKQINNHYQGRITLNIYTRNVLHANVYVFYLPFRKAVAFVGSGTFSSEGLKDHEELFWKITDAKEIESVMSWFTSYFEFGIPLTDFFVSEYEQCYPVMKQREIASMLAKQQLITSSNLHWDSIKFKNQYFKKEEFQIFSNANAFGDNAATRLARMEVQSKLLQLKDSLNDQMDAFKLSLGKEGASVSTVDPKDHPDQIINSMSISFDDRGIDSGLVKFQAGISGINFSVRLVIAGPQSTRKERDYIKSLLSVEVSRANFVTALAKLNGYTLEIAGVKKSIESLSSEQIFAEFIKADYGLHFNVTIEKYFSPGDGAISEDKIVSTVLAEFVRLVGFSKSVFSAA
jgi:hypothetical protein